MAKKSASGAAGTKLVIVESPTKAKTIRKFLGKEYVVESCMGHIRDLPQSAKDIPEKYKKQPWARLGVNVDEDFDPIYTIPKNKTKVIKTLKDKLEDANELYLATDEDREGESISWHLVETLKPKVPFKRMVFNEITKTAILDALKDTRQIDTNLVKAQEARRILDRLVGYTISPLLWTKVAFGLSAGRVQSVAVRLIVEREHERLRFKKSVYWGVETDNEKDTVKFASRLLSYEGKRIATGRDFDETTGQLLKDKAGEVLHLDEKKAGSVKQAITSQAWKVIEAEEKPVSRKPPAPFITSTLQQEANRKLGLSAREAMQVAQNLYEHGYITYMRTDSTFLSTQALDAARARIKVLYGKDYLPEAPRTYEGKKAKGAQEAHEAIRPSGTEWPTPEETGLSGMPLRLYELIWKRTMASQMVNSRQKQVSVRFEVGAAVFATSGMTIEFPGFLRAYVEGSDDENAALDEKEVRLPDLKVGDSVKCTAVRDMEHETKPPARFTEASLVQTMEKEGIGRPSTYASIIGTIIDRGYVKKMGNALAPTFTAMVVGKLLKNHLPQYVDLGFTSEMEKALDDIADGDLDHLSYLKSVYFGEQGLKKQVERQEKKIDPDEARGIKLDGLKDLSFRVGRYGAYVCRPNGEEGESCASIPEAQAPADITAEIANKLIDQKINGSDALGKDPKSGEPIYVLTGRYGPYVQLGDATDENAKPKRVSLPAGMEPETVTIATALQLLELPKTLGSHPGTGKEIKAGLGRFGPYIVHDGDFRSIPKTDNLFTIDLARALEIYSKPKAGRGRAAPIKELGKVDGTGDAVSVFSGKYGPYIKCGKTNVSLPEDMKPEAVTMEIALDLITAKTGERPNGVATEEAPAKGKTPKAKKKKEKSADTDVKSADSGKASSKAKAAKSGAKSQDSAGAPAKAVAKA
ncbi:MAG TPA: type I DNA topoisomerase, partial [Bdellovibrionales bacterium]|nr:type I DNA topoisomerase [Bdellovibrionales bacterium]